MRFTIAVALILLLLADTQAQYPYSHRGGVNVPAHAYGPPLPSHAYGPQYANTLIMPRDTYRPSYDGYQHRCGPPVGYYAPVQPMYYYQPTYFQPTFQPAFRGYMGVPFRR